LTSIIIPITNNRRQCELNQIDYLVNSPRNDNLFIEPLSRNCINSDLNYYLE